ncbi:MAG: choice-of-anchor L domain-containing protein [Fimbriimonadaceae bacterium]|nr:choice-of-anchor L domain-containing protein [Chitinophagales bacterium]
MMYLRCSSLLLTICTVVFLTDIAFAQIDVIESTSGEELATSLVGVGVTLSEIELDCYDGGAGFFNCIDCSLGIDSGIVLTSGNAIFVEGPNDSGSDGMDVGTDGDSDLETLLPGFESYDACVLEFDLTVTSDTVVFDYVFGSEEYLEWVGSSYNDVFGFFISGPGITDLENIALVPGTSTAVSINNVNSGSYSEYYVDNGDGYTSPYSTDEYYIQLDGYTTVLTAKRAVIPCETYHLKLAISDMGDGVLDSGVFIKAESLSSPGVEITYSTDLGGYPDLIETCNNGTLILDLSFAPVDTFEVIINVLGTATNGVDYETIPTTIEFLPGEVSYTLPIIVLEDALTEGLETIVFTVESGGCITGIGDSLIVNVHDYLPLSIIPIDTIICPGASVTIEADGATSYSWSPAETLSNATGEITEATPAENIVYSVTGTLGACINTVTSTVNLSPPLANAGNDTTIIISESATLNGSGGTDYSWTPSGSLNDPNAQNPIATPTTTTTYTVTVTDENGCVSYDEVTVFVSNTPIIVFPNAFSPNGDGFNDLFSMVNRGVLASFAMSIYNRWGELVFETTSTDPAWDGTYNSNEQPIGNYVYVFEASDFDGNIYSHKGAFTLVR